MVLSRTKCQICFCFLRNNSVFLVSSHSYNGFGNHTCLFDLYHPTCRTHHLSPSDGPSLRTCSVLATFLLLINIPVHRSAELSYSELIWFYLATILHKYILCVRTPGIWSAARLILAPHIYQHLRPSHYGYPVPRTHHTYTNAVRYPLVRMTLIKFKIITNLNIIYYY